MTIKQMTELPYIPGIIEKTTGKPSTFSII